ncbi:MAG: glycoside hydrolase family 18 protein [Janthinobacterium lividum]
MQRSFPFILFASLVLIALADSSPAQRSAPTPLLVGYFGQWSLYDDPHYTLKNLASHGRIDMLDQLNYAQGFVTGGHCSIADRNADLDHVFKASESVSGIGDDATSSFRGNLHQLAELKLAHPRLKALISLEGRGSDFAFDARPENRQAFVASCVALFLKGDLAANVSAPGLFDGIDVDWEYPQGPDAENFLALLKEFRQQMDRLRPGLKLTIAVGPSPRMYSGTDFQAVSAQVDEVGLMTYDMAGPWMQTTGFIAPLYRVPALPENRQEPSASGASLTPPRPPAAGGVSGSVQAFLTAGVPAGKILVGVPFYGYGWTQVPEAGEGVYQEGMPVDGDRPYSYIQTLFPNSRTYRDPVSQTPWLFDGDVFWTFDDPVSIHAKAAFAVEHGLGGLMIWELSNDTADGSLLTAARQGLSPQ